MFEGMQLQIHQQHKCRAVSRMRQLSMLSFAISGKCSVSVAST